MRKLAIRGPWRADHREWRIPRRHHPRYRFHGRAWTPSTGETGSIVVDNPTGRGDPTMRRRWSVALLAVALVTGSGSALPAEEATIRAVSAASGQGVFVEIGEQRALFMGAFRGILYVESGPETLDGASIVCPASFLLEGLTPNFSAHGYCTIVAADGAKLYAEWRCSGEVFKGCRGTLTLTGGTERFARVTGMSEVRLRTSLPRFTDLGDPRTSPGLVQETASALLVLPALRYRLP
jgi:hypothetical protein